ncbi:MAG TPA: SDR family oxidoreductase [Burkholderiaceae bacterium]|nr:SDR family oxidoreductase [Burkholderiaceae bacterium]
MPSTILIVGASRGIGLEFVRQYAAAGDRVLATCRKDADAGHLRMLGATALPLDVLDADSRARLVEQIGDARLDLVVLSAGVYGPRTSGLEAPDAAEFDRVMHTNVLAPMHLITLLAPLLAQTGAKVAVISSRMGSIGLMNSAYGWLYRASKAALNAALRATSLELGARRVVCMAFHPGWVRTDMGGAGAAIDVAESVGNLRRVIAQANESHNGKFLNYTGEHLSW